MSVRIIGNEQEIEWAKEALRNQCNDCPYLDCCNEKAKGVKAVWNGSVWLPGVSERED